MNQNIWGSHLWFSLHTITFTYPLKPTHNEKIEFRNFFLALQNVIPCSVCKRNYKRHLQEKPIEPHLESRKDLVYWLIDIHNMVNAEIGKKILPYETVIKKYENVYQKNLLEVDHCYSSSNDNTQFNKQLYMYFLLFLFIIFIIFITRISIPTGIPKNY
jgi:hypothetical protein